MSFSGDLEHLPIVDVIQLLHSTRKTGTLFLQSSKGSSQLVFSDGYFVSANHHSNKYRIGQILMDMGAITQNDLNNALMLQKEAGTDRKPLVATLIEQGIIDKDVAYKGLETLIEMTIVEILTWTSGTFHLDVLKADISDEYRYFPETLKEEMLLNAQSILMDALRIYDEHMRDGTLEELFFSDNDELKDGESDCSVITPDLLGLDVLDTLDKKIPDVFMGLRDHDQAGEHRLFIEQQAPGLMPDELENVCSYLASLSRPVSQTSTRKPILPGTAPAVIVYSFSPLLRHVIATSSRGDGIFVMTTDEEAGLDLIIEQSICRDSVPVLIVDVTSIPEDKSSEDLLLQMVRNKRIRYPSLTILTLVLPPGLAGLSLPLLEAGVRAVLPMPDSRKLESLSAGELISCNNVLRGYLKTSFSAMERQAIRSFDEVVHALIKLSEPPEIALELLRFAATIFDRAVTFVVGRDELIAEKGVGVRGGTLESPAPPMMFRIPLKPSSVFSEVVAKQKLHFGLSGDPLLAECLYREISPPANARFMLAPVTSFGKTMALVYADFGSSVCRPAPTELMNALVRHAGLVLDFAVYRKRFPIPST